MTRPTILVAAAPLAPPRRRAALFHLRPKPRRPRRRAAAPPRRRAALFHLRPTPRRRPAPPIFAPIAAYPKSLPFAAPHWCTRGQSGAALVRKIRGKNP
jgi:hypothetical protein